MSALTGANLGDETELAEDEPLASFRITLNYLDIHRSARKHGVADDDIIHAVDHALATEDPDRWLVIGPDHSGNLLEVIVLTTVEDSQLAIHAMPMRAKVGRLLGS
ncbi:MAG: hypothetical protein ACR2FG_10360 [Marmoricola sp.]